ncbi:hypothetical protein ACFVIX_06105 [Bacillus subtilis]|uniref:hypothetical protein n=2 Tax=Bacillus subtilis TaxID=1423 RepID=UPI001CFC25DE|nr:hypothetical protein [Bacillus subtilis]MCB4341072.1 hypothetical protein [Bacillus subtilis]
MNNEVIQNLRKFVIQTDKSLAVLSDAISKKTQKIDEIKEEIDAGFLELSKEVSPFIKVLPVIFKELSKAAEILPTGEYIKNWTLETSQDVIKYSSNFGWTFNEYMGGVDIINPDILNMDKKQIDAYYMSLFEEIYVDIKPVILNRVESNHTILLEECFYTIETGKFAVSLPALILIIEGEISTFTESEKVGWRLMDEWEKSLSTNDQMKNDSLRAISAYSLVEYLKNALFARQTFNQQRLSDINRNWVYHGRDNSSLWTKTDVYKLLNILTTISTLKHLSKERLV